MEEKDLKDFDEQRYHREMSLRVNIGASLVSALNANIFYRGLLLLLVVCFVPAMVGECRESFRLRKWGKRGEFRKFREAGRQ